jgi:hypothetical protein
MQSEEREGCSGHGCGAGAGQEYAQEQTDLNSAAEHVFEKLRLLAEESAVTVCCCWPWLALCD